MFVHLSWLAVYCFLGGCWCIANEATDLAEIWVCFIFWWFILPTKVVIGVMRFIVKMSAN